MLAGATIEMPSPELAKVGAPELSDDEPAKVTVLNMGRVDCPVQTGSTKKPLITLLFHTRDPPVGSQRPKVPIHA